MSSFSWRRHSAATPPHRPNVLYIDPRAQTMDIGKYTKKKRFNNPLRRNNNNPSNDDDYNHNHQDSGAMKERRPGLRNRIVNWLARRQERRREDRDNQGRSRGENVTAFSSMGSLSSYAGASVSSAPLPACFGPGSTSEAMIRRRFIREDVSPDELVFKHHEGGKVKTLYYPEFNIAEWTNEWWTESIAILNNSIRWEIMDLYTILSSLQKRWNEVYLCEMSELSCWWETFELFCEQHLEIEDQILLPWLKEQASHTCQKFIRYEKMVRYNKKVLIGKLKEIGAMIERFNSAPASDVLPALYKLIIDFLPKVLDYMKQQEEVLPGVIREFCEPNDRELLNRAAANFLVRAAKGRDGIALLTRWMEDPVLLHRWIDENLSGRAKSSRKKWVTRLEKNHLDIPKRFKRRMRNNPSRMGSELSNASSQQQF